MAEYIRQKDVQPVCSINEAREYFSNCGLTYRRREKPMANRPVIGAEWIKKHRHHGGVRRYTGTDDMGEVHTITVDERVEYDDLYCSRCGKQSPGAGGQTPGGDLWQAGGRVKRA